MNCVSYTSECLAAAHTYNPTILVTEFDVSDYDYSFLNWEKEREFHLFGWNAFFNYLNLKFTNWVLVSYICLFVFYSLWHSTIGLKIVIMIFIWIFFRVFNKDMCLSLKHSSQIISKSLQTSPGYSLLKISIRIIGFTHCTLEINTLL